MQKTRFFILLLFPIFVEGQTIESSQALEIVIPRSDRKTLEDVSPEALLRYADHRSDSSNHSGFGSHLKSSVAYGFKHTLHHLPAEASIYFAAVGALAVYDCAIEVKDHPMACPLFGKSLKDPLTHLSFFLFMGANHSTSHFLNTGGPSFIPRFAVNYIGMAAGSLVSGLAIDFLTDTDIRYIREYFFKEKTPIEKELFAQAWQNAYEKFVLDPLHISYHTPHLVSLVLSSFLASFTYKSISSTLAVSEAMIKNISYRLVDRIESQPIEFVQSRGSHVFRYSKTSYFTNRIILRSLKFVIRVSPQAMMAVPGVGPVLGVTMRIGHLILFFAWDHFLHPPIRKAYNLNRITQKLNEEKTSILHHLTSSYQEQQRNNDQSSTYNATNMGFLSFFSLAWWQNQRQRAKDRSQFLGIQNTLNRILNKNPNANSTHIDPWIVDPWVTDSNELNLLDLPYLIEQMDANKSETQRVKTQRVETQRARTQKARGDILLDHIFQFDFHVQEYRKALSLEIDTTIDEWKAFFEPFYGWLYTTSNFYSYLIKTRGQLHFESESQPYPYAPDLVNKSRGMLDALYFSSRLFDESNNLPTLRLFRESKLLHFGVQPQVVHKLSDQDLKNIVDRLTTEHQNTLSGRRPTNEHLYLIDYLNFGFDASRVGHFDEFDFQVRSEVFRNPIINGLKVDILDNKNTQEIFELIQFLKNQSEGDRPYYIRLANQGRGFDELYQIASQNNFDELYQSHQTTATQEESLNKESLDHLENNRNIVQAKFFDNSLYPNPLTKKHYGIMYFSSVEKLLISLVCGESLEDLQHDLVQRSHFGLGALKFNAPRLWSHTPALCQKIKHVHHGFFTEENGQDVFYYNLLDYVSQNIGSQMTSDEFVWFWNNKVLQAVNPILSEYMGMKTAALTEKMSDVYNNTAYGYDYSDPNYTIDFPTIGYARGIYYFERDITNYYLNLLTSLLPVQDRDFILALNSHINNLRDLSLKSHSSNIYEDLNITLEATYQLIEAQLQSQNSNDVLLLRVVSAILAKIKESILYSNQKAFLTLF